jgi:hypothetical protein
VARYHETDLELPRCVSNQLSEVQIVMHITARSCKLKMNSVSAHLDLISFYPSYSLSGICSLPPLPSFPSSLSPCPYSHPQRSIPRISRTRILRSQSRDLRLSSKTRILASLIIKSVYSFPSIKIRQLPKKPPKL